MSLSSIHEKKGPASGENELGSSKEDEVTQITARPVEEPPDGGYGWVIVICVFLSNAVTWGINSSFGVFLSFYSNTNFFPGASDVDFAVVGGLSIGCAMAIAPLSNYLSKRYKNFKVPLWIGLIIYTISQIAAGFSTQIWELFLTQGLLFGAGLGLLFIPMSPLSNQWFSKKRALANGLLAAGSGAGAILFSLIVQAIIERLGLRWAFFINAFISIVILIPVILLLKSRTAVIHAKFEPLQPKLLLHPGFMPVYIWGIFTLLGYVLALYTIATYATAGLGLSQNQGAIMQSLLAAGQIVGRPISGLLMDRWGRINIAVIWTAMAGISCLVVWMLARNEGVLGFFAFLQGMTGGIFWSASGPIVTEIIGLTDLGSALSILWLSIVPSCIFSEPIAIWLLAEAQSRTGITFSDSDSDSTTHSTNQGVSGAGTGDQSGAVVFRTTIAFAGTMFIVGAIVLYWAKRWKQGSWKVFIKT